MVVDRAPLTDVCRAPLCSSIFTSAAGGAPTGLPASCTLAHESPQRIDVVEPVNDSFCYRLAFAVRQAAAFKATRHFWTPRSHARLGSQLSHGSGVFGHATPRGKPTMHCDNQ